MRITTLCALIMAGGLLVGCGEPGASTTLSPDVSQAVRVSAEGKDLAVAVQLPKSQFVVGETVPITIVATNRGAEGLRFSSPTSAPYRIRLEKAQPLGWETVKTYPEAAAMVLTEWTLPPGQKRTMQTKLVVERDWPTYENLRLRVNLSERQDVAPFVHIEVVPAEK